MKVQNAILVSLNISVWEANRQDRKMSSEIAEANGVKDKRLCRLRKSLLPKSEVMRKLFSVVRAARNFHYENTLPWMHDGPRMLLTSNFDEYTRRMRAFSDDFEAAVLDAEKRYEELKAEASQVLGKLYNEKDYPPAAELRRRYGFDVKYQPMPSAASFLELGLEPEQAAEIRTKLEADLRETYERANRAVWEDLYGRLEKLKDCLSDEKSRFRDGTIRAVADLSEMLPRLNITNDERLTVLGTRLKNAFGSLTSDAVRADDKLRERAAAEARSVFNVMSAFMSPAAPRVSAAGDSEGLRRAA